MNNYEHHAFLGNGCHFPVGVFSVTGQFEESVCEDNIKESIYIIIMTQKGERVMRPDFGFLSRQEGFVLNDIIYS